MFTSYSTTEPFLKIERLENENIFRNGLRGGFLKLLKKRLTETQNLIDWPADGKIRFLATTNSAGYW